jgi:hypothetical protein
MMKTIPPCATFVALATATFVSGALAGDNDKAREDMQRQLNQQVMSAPFNAGDIKKAEEYSENAKKEGVVPAAQGPAYWAPGWTCANIAAYRYYAYGDYQNCVYYHYYYGRYWR